MPLLSLLRDIQQHAHTHQRHRQRRSAVGNKWERNPFRRHHPEHYADVDEGLQHDHAGDSNRQEAAKIILRAQRRPRSSPKKDRKKHYDSQRTNQSQLFGCNRKDKVGVRLGKIKQLLLPFHQSQSSDAPSRDRNQRLNNVEAKSLRIGVRIHKSQNAISAVRHMKDQKIERQQRGGKSVSEVAQPNSSDKQNTSGDSGASDGRTEIRLKHDQPQKNHSRDDRGNQRIAPIVNSLRFIFQKPSEK